MIIGRGKRSIEEHFDRNTELELELAQKDKQDELDSIQRISNLADIHFVWQKRLNGLGDAVSYARNHVGSEPFAVLRHVVERYRVGQGERRAKRNHVKQIDNQHTGEVGTRGEQCHG